MTPAEPAAPAADGSWRVTARDGWIDLVAPATQVRIECRPEVVYRRGNQINTWRPELVRSGDGFAAASNDTGLRLRLVVRPDGSATVVRGELKNEGGDRVHLARIAPLATDDEGACHIGARADRWSVLRNGYQSWTGTRSFRADEFDPDPWSGLLKIGLIDIRNPSPQRPGHFRSHMFGAVKNLESGEAVVAGFLTGHRAFGTLEVRVAGERCVRFAAMLDYDEIALDPGDTIPTEPVWLASGWSENDLLAAYASAVGAAMGARVAARNPIGWCSWYYYFTRVTEDDVLDNLRALAELRSRYPCNYIQIDDGYQAEIGDWLIANGKFPHGMAWLAEQIRNTGFDAGIWTAPFLARSGSRLLAEHPEWFVKNRRGRPRFALYNPLWGKWGNCYALDTTHPEALDWVRRTFGTIAREWGYRVLKLDFLYAAALPGCRHDPRATRAAALRRGLEAIREAVGDEVFLLGCGCPLAPAIGVVDAMRIGPDVAPFWTNFGSRVPCRDLHGLATKHAIRNTLTRAFMHRQWWLNDPDCLMVRDAETELTADEVRSLATVIAATDGMIVLSDRIDRLSEERLGVLSRTQQLCGGHAHVVDLFRGDLPELVVSRTPERTVVAVFNFADEPRRKQVDLNALEVSSAASGDVVEWWTGAGVPTVDGHVDFEEVPPHGCRVLVWPQT